MPYQYKFTGVIYPQRVNFSVSKKLGLHLEMSSFGIKGDIEIEFKNSQFTAIFTSDNKHKDTSNLETLKNYIEDSVRMIVDIYCYVNSYNYDVEVTKVECKALNIDYTFPVRGEWNINKTQKDANEEFTKLLQVFSKPDFVFLKDVLADFRRAIKYPAMTSPHCYRAIETIRQFYFEDSSITNDQKRRDDGWEKLRNALNLQRKDFDEIQKFAIPGRHGKYPKIEYKERESIMNFTRRIIDGVISDIENNLI